jgi:hypothetical protein
MKKGFVVFMQLALIFVIGAPVFSQPSEKSVETTLIDNFDTPDQMEWTWSVQASRFIADGYPVLKYSKGISHSLRPFVKEGDPEPQVLGVKVAYNRKGDNWFEVYPTKDDKPYEIPFVGNVSQIDFWVWGSNYLYFLDLLVRDSGGSVHVIPAGNLAFSGWKNLIVSVPTYIRQSARLHTAPESMTFVGFRIRAHGSEYADDFSIFFDKLQYTSSILTNVYDGYELRKEDFGESSKEGQ